MIRLAKLQFLGPLAVLFAVGAAEAAAFALACNPMSETLWFVNLKVFQVFQESSFRLPAPLDFPYAQFFLIALPLFIMAAYGLFAKRTFPLALASHLSFIYVGYLFYNLASSQPQTLAASITTIAISDRPTIYLPVFLAGACFISFLISHCQYLFGFFSARHKSFPHPNNP